MKNSLHFIKSKSILYKLVILFALLSSLPFTGSDCENGIIGNGITGDIAGTWQLTSMTGYLQDVCAGEVVTYDSSGIATLQCPNSNPITRNYTVSNDILTYTETGVQYNITNLSNTTLTLEGRNIGRTLSYTRLPADRITGKKESTSQTGKNSSE
jgi:hypothetical protein